MTMNRRAPLAMLVLAASSLTVGYAADRSGRWTVTPTKQVDNHQQVQAARDDRVDAQVMFSAPVLTVVALGHVVVGEQRPMMIGDDVDDDSELVSTRQQNEGRVV